MKGLQRMGLRSVLFDKFCVSRLLASAMVAMMVLVPAFAAADNGCNDEENNRITPVLALCSAHAYNIREVGNPGSDSQKQLMRDVVALKSTVMMQQMYKQYQFLEATVSRLKTQLEREILTSKLEVAGASSGGASKSSTTGINAGVDGAENCRTGTTEDVMNCLNRNLNRIVTAINNSDLGAARRQIETDRNTLNMYSQFTNANMPSACTSMLDKCEDLEYNRNDMNECVDYMRVCITRNLEEINQPAYNVFNPFAVN